MFLLMTGCLLWGRWADKRGKTPGKMTGRKGKRCGCWFKLLTRAAGAKQGHREGRRATSTVNARPAWSARTSQIVHTARHQRGTAQSWHLVPLLRTRAWGSDEWAAVVRCFSCAWCYQLRSVLEDVSVALDDARREQFAAEVVKSKSKTPSSHFELIRTMEIHPQVPSCC